MGSGSHTKQDLRGDPSPGIQLVRMLGVPSLLQPRAELEESDLALKYARRNRLAFLYLSELARVGQLADLQDEHERERRRHARLHQVLRELVPALESTGVEYVLLRALRYFPANPTDIDLIVLGDESDYRSVWEAIRSLGYVDERVAAGGRTLFRDPHCPRDGDPVDPSECFEIDLYRDFTVSELVYFDRSRLTGLSQFRVFVSPVDGSDTVARVLPPWLDLFVSCLRSLFPKGSYPLELFYNSIYLLRQCEESDLRSFVALTRDVHLEHPIAHVLGLTRAILRQALDQTDERLDYLWAQVGGPGRGEDEEPVSSYRFPHKYCIALFLSTGLRASLTHSGGIRSTGRMLKRMLDPRFAMRAVGARRPRALLIPPPARGFPRAARAEDGSPDEAA